MADTNPTITNPTATGMSTSEGKFTLAAQVIGFLLSTFGALLTQYSATHPGSPWAGPAVVAMGVLMMTVTHYGYVKGRAIVKNAMLENAIDWAAPEAAALVAKLLAKQLAPASAPVNSVAAMAQALETHSVIIPPHEAALAPPK